MCVALVKYFYDIGWVGVKNRDRNYVPEINFEINKQGPIPRLLFHDDYTGYMEGLNVNGIGILGTSLMNADDEIEITRSSKDNPDGEKIKSALQEKTIEKEAQACIDEELTGCTFIFDTERCFLIEACIRDNKYIYDMEEIKKNKPTARTNHGIYLPWAGYQKGQSVKEDLSRESSESRLKQAMDVLKHAKTPQDLIDGLTMQPNHKNSQMNALRMTTAKKKMRTTAQEMIIPIEQTFYLRPVQSKLEIDFWKINQDPTSLWVEILSNRSLYKKPKTTLD